MNLLTKNTFKSLLLFLLFIYTTSCSSLSDEKNPETANDYIYAQFKEWYLWNDQLPEIDPNSYPTQSELIKALVTDVDRWSFSGSYSQISKFLEAGELTAFGAGFMLDFDNQVKITYVYPDSPFGKLGVQRGWVVESANGFGTNDLVGLNTALSSDAEVVFHFTSTSGELINATLKKEKINLKTVLYSTILKESDKRIGYLVFSSFLEISKTELEQAFSNFAQNNITDLIVDLRYNGGGLNDVALQLISQIGSNKVKNQVVSKMVHNTQKSAYNKEDKAPENKTSVNISKVFFLTGQGTASASELVINALSPFMDVRLVGSQTHGKPVGMYVFHVDKLDLAIVPICFKTVNVLGEGDYFSGIPVDITEIDDLSHNWGDPEEAMLKAALNDILAPAVAALPNMKSSYATQQQLLDYKGLNQTINAW